MQTVLPLATVEGIIQLLNEGKFSQREIADKMAVCQTTVSDVASGKRGLFGRTRHMRQFSPTIPNVLPERCRGCGGMVYKPCLLCKARRYRRQEKLADCSSDSRRVA